MTSVIVVGIMGMWYDSTPYSDPTRLEARQPSRLHVKLSPAKPIWSDEIAYSE